MKPEIDETLAELRKYIGERLIPNESDFLGIFGRVSDYGKTGKGVELFFLHKTL